MKKYEQLYKKIKNDIETGILPLGVKLLSIREESLISGLSKNTVIKAYELLSDDGIIIPKERGGYYVNNSKQIPHINTEQVTESYKIDSKESGERLDKLFDRLTSIDPTFAYAVLGPDLLPGSELTNLFPKSAKGWIEYDTNYGDFNLRKKLAYLNSEIDGSTSPDDIIITNGATEGLNIVFNTLLEPGDRIIIESPTYYNFIRQLAPLGVEIIEIPVNKNGLNLKLLETELKKAPVKAILVQPNVQNPTGATMDDASKLKLISLSQLYNTFLIQDDVHGDLHYSRVRPSNLGSLSNYKKIITVSSYSKSVAPGLRVGWIRSPYYKELFLEEKIRSSMDTSRLSQLVIREYIGTKAHRRHLTNIRVELQKRTNSYMKLLYEILPKGSFIQKPTGGCILWIYLPKGMDSTIYFKKAAQKGVITAPGPLFSSSNNYNNCIRINTGFQLTEERIAALRGI